jgi:PBSX family phage terminase large subunit
MDLPFSPKQIGSLRQSTARVNVWEGSIRSGKTIASLVRFLIFVATAPTGGQLVVIARTRDTAARNVFAPLQDESLFGDAAKHVHYTAGAPSAKVLGRTVYVIGASDAKSEKVLRGLTVAGAYVDEITVIPEEFFTQLLGRMSVAGAQLFGTTNPDNPAHWLKAKFLDRITPKDSDKGLPDWRRFHFTLHDNPSLTPEYIESISREFTGLWYRRFILGEWVAAEGAIFDMWDPERHVIAWDDLPPIRRMIAVGIDYGTQHATSAILLGLGYNRNLYLIDELRLDPKQSQRRLTDAEQSHLIAEWLKTSHLPPGQYQLAPEWRIADQAGASLREQLGRDGVDTVAADKQVEYGIGVMASLLGEHHLFVSDRCHGFIGEVPGYSWDPAAAAKGKDAPIKTADDSLDAARYAIVTTESVWRDEMAVRPDFF